jgi:hypothetical protein
MKLGFWKLKVTAGIGNKSAHMACLTNLMSQPRLGISRFWIPFMRLPTHREDLYDVTHSSWVSIRFSTRCSVFTPQMVLAVGTKCFYKVLHLILCIGCHELGLLARFVAYNFHFSFCLSFRSVHALSQFLLHIFLFSPFSKALSLVFTWL